jgi:hypothetical protein
MPTDPRIALGVQSPQLDDPVQKIMTLRALAQRQAGEQQQQQMQGQQIELNKLKLAGEQREAAGIAAMSAALKGSQEDDPETGLPRVNYARAAATLVDQGFADLGQHLLEVDQKTQTSKMAYHTSLAAFQAAGKERLGELAHEASQLVQSGQPTNVVKTGIIARVAIAAGDGLITEEDAHRFIAQSAAATPDQLVSMFDQFVTPSIREREGKLKAQAATTAKTEADTAKTLAETAGTLPETAAQKSTRLLGEARLRLAQQKEGREATTAKENDVALELTPEGKTLVAKQFAMTGLLPSLGSGAAGAKLRTEVINEAAKVYSGLDLASQRAAFDANKAALTGLERQRAAMGAFEETATKNLAVFLEQAKNIVDTGSPYLNRPLRSLDEKLLGSPQMTAFSTARRTVIPEFAKILANPGLSGQLTDTARKEIEDVVSGDATLQQTLAAANVLMRDVKNRTTAYDEAIAAVKGRIATPPGQPAAATGPQEGDTKPITDPGYPAGAEQTYRGGRWIRTK